jgi:hypothetical protein
LRVSVIVTAPPYAPFLEEVARHLLVEGLRLNTVMPVRGGPREALARLSSLETTLWVDLKGRQLRVVGAAVPPYTELRLSHRIEVATPVDAYLTDGRERIQVVDVDGDRLILGDGPRRLVGPGESVNIVDPSLRVEGYLTALDRSFLGAMAEAGLSHVMLSYVESEQDIAEVRELLPECEPVLKIESQHGLDLARWHGSRLGRLMAARGDLYVEVLRPHRIVGALRDIVEADPAAIVASRLCESLASFPVPECADIGDLAFLMAIGYRSFMLGDALCFRRESVLAALDLIAAVAEQMP